MNVPTETAEAAAARSIGSSRIIDWNSIKHTSTEKIECFDFERESERENERKKERVEENVML